MRTFVLYSRARSDGNFKPADLSGSGRRMDLVCRCVTAAIWLSHKLRQDVEFIASLNGPAKPPAAVRFFGGNLRRLSPDERSVGAWLKKALSAKRSSEWASLWNGIGYCSKSFQALIDELADRPIYVLHEKGQPIEQIEFEQDPVFVLGDHLGIPKKEESYALRRGQKISLGRMSYLASQCIAVINWWLDQ